MVRSRQWRFGPALSALLLALAVASPVATQTPRESIPPELVSPPELDRVKPLLDHAEPPPARPPRTPADLVSREPVTDELFVDPPARYRPWTRWWWLGNNVEEAELRREVALFVAKGFGGVEIQAFSLGDRVDRRSGVRDRVLSFDSEEFWGNVRATLDAARGAGLGVDLNHGSGWPAGGPWVGLADTYETLIYVETSVDGGAEGRAVAIALPEPRVPLGYELTLLLERVFGSEVISFPVEHRRLVSVVAAREVGPEGASASSPDGAASGRPGYSSDRELVVRDGSETGRFEAVRDGSAQRGGSAAPGREATPSGGAAGTAKRVPVALDATTVRVLDTEVHDGELRWQVPAGKWRVVAVYAMPAGEAPTLVAAPRAGLVLDHFHPAKVRAHYDYLLGMRTGMDAYWAAPLRGFFNDSLEFKVERHWTPDFFAEFQKRRGYDLRPWLPALFVAAADNFFVSDVFGVHPDPDFALGDGGERVRWDYEHTVSDLVIERFYDTSGEWAAARGLLSRAQGYGMALDPIRAAGHIDIPETEALYAGGSDLFLKLASAGAHLYGRPLVSAESFVWRGAEYRTTPQKVRAAADKLFTAGVNHVVWHGTPYQVARAQSEAAGAASRGGAPPSQDGFGEEGWYPWSIPGANLGFSTNFSEASPFWRDAEAINRYLARAQLLLRQGTPEADVLVYFPFQRFPSSFGNDADVADREDLFNGWLREAEPVVPSSSLAGLLGDKAESREDPLVPWLREQQQLLQSIEEAGLTWEWINAESLEAARWSRRGIEVGDGRYGAILLAAAPWLPAKTAEAVATLAEAGAPVFVHGNPPARQPGFFGAERGDARVREAMDRVRRATDSRGREARRGGSAFLPDALRAAVAPTTLVERRASSPAIRHLGRALGEDRAPGVAAGDAVVLVRNASSEPARCELRLPRSRTRASARAGSLFLLDAVSGSIRAADPIEDPKDGGWIAIELAPRDSIFVVSGFPLTPTPIEDWPAKFLQENDLTTSTRDVRRRLAPGTLAPATLPPSALDTWELSIDGPDLAEGRFERRGVLFDWREEPKLRFVSSPGRYRTTVEIAAIDAGSRYLLDLGRVLHAADVTVNGRAFEPLLFSPFVIEVTEALRAGTNTIEVSVRSPLLDRFIGYAERGDARYARFAGRPTLSTGLLGPVVLRALPR